MNVPLNSIGGRTSTGRLESDPVQAESSRGASSARQKCSSFPHFLDAAQQKDRDTNGGSEGGGGSIRANDDDPDPYGGDDDSFDAAELPNDTMAAVLSLQKEFYGGTGMAGRNSARGGGHRDGDGGERTGIVLQHQM